MKIDGLDDQDAFLYRRIDEGDFTPGRCYPPHIHLRSLGGGKQVGDVPPSLPIPDNPHPGFFQADFPDHEPLFQDIG